MSDSDFFHQPGELKIGPDRVWFLSHSLVIYAAREMPDWEVREYCPAAIYFYDQRYLLIQKNRAGPRGFRYELKPWPADLHETPSAVITYDDDYVRQRDETARRGTRVSGTHSVLVALSPLLGLLPSATKKYLAENFGINPQSTTRFSLGLEMFILLLHSLFWSWSGGLMTVILALAAPGQLQIGTWTPGPAFAHLSALVLVAWDAVIRYDQLLREIEYPYGAFEWFFRLFRRS